MRQDTDMITPPEIRAERQPLVHIKHVISREDLGFLPPYGCPCSHTAKVATQGRSHAVP